MARKPTVTIVGPGNLGSALGISLRAAGYRIPEVVSRSGRSSRKKGRSLAGKIGARAETTSSARLDAETIWFCVPDREIAIVAHSLARHTCWKGKVALHSSGALASDELESLRHKGAAVASLHPLMTFVRPALQCLAGVPFAFEGDHAAMLVARRIVKNLQGDFFTIAKQQKAAYHAWGAFTSPLLLAALATAEEVAGIAGIDRKTARRKMLPIVRQTIENYASRGPEGAFSGPIIRGDADTISRHLKALRGARGAREVYLALARSAMRNLPVRNRRALAKILK